MTKNHVHIVKMGGTIEFIDPSYDEINKKLMKLDTTVESYLNNLIKPHFNFSVETVTQKDSRDITSQDRDDLIAEINSSPHKNILVTHGTFTMKETALYLEEHGVKDKKVIITGSMVPITGFTISDAGFNLGFSIASFESLENGIYICMNGGIFNTSETEKNVSEFRFE